MKNSTKTLVIVAVLVVLGIGAYSFSQKSSPQEPMMQKDETVIPNDVQMDDKASGSRYVEYTKETLDNASYNRRVLFFYASWCPTCQPADASFTQNLNKIPQDVTVIRVNYNDAETDPKEKDLAKMYGVTYQHTFVQIDSQGKEVTKWNGGQIDELLTNIN